MLQWKLPNFFRTDLYAEKLKVFVPFWFLSLSSNIGEINHFCIISLEIELGVLYIVINFTVITWLKSNDLYNFYMDAVDILIYRYKKLFSITQVKNVTSQQASNDLTSRITTSSICNRMHTSQWAVRSLWAQGYVMWVPSKVTAISHQLP